MNKQFNVRSGLRAGDQEDCAKAVSEMVQKCNLSGNQELLSSLSNQFAQAGMNLGSGFAQSGQDAGNQWAQFGMSFIP